MNRSYLVMILILAIIWGACSDDEPSVSLDLNKTYSFNRVEASPIRIFTINGEIKDKKSQQKALIRFNEINTFNFKFLSGDEGLEIFEIEYIEFDNNLATINSTDQYSYSVTDDFLRLIDVDTSLFYYPLEATTNTNPVLDSIALYSWLYKEVDLIKRDNPMPGTTGYVKRMKYLDERYARIRSGQIRLQILYSFYFLHHNGGIRESALKINNEFNGKIYEKMSAMDTLLIQESSIIYD